MGVEIMWKQTVLVAALVSATTAQAECYIRSAMTAQAKLKITRITDVHTLVVPVSDTQNKCLVNFRAQINNEWITVDGENIGARKMSEDLLCKGAMDQGRTQVLNRANSRDVTVENNMVCTDQPIPQIRRVQVGDMVKESEVQPHRNYPNPFVYRNATCRWFNEPEVTVGDLLNRQGIICRMHDDEWQVVDKW